MAMIDEGRRPIDGERVEEFVGQAVADVAGAMVTAFCALGDRLGLFKALAERAATSEELATATGLHERYVREWAKGLVAAGYLIRDPETERYAIPPEHAPVLADEGGLAFLGGLYQLVREMLGTIDRVERSFREGGGIGLEEYGDEFWTGLERLTGPSFEHQLVQEWIPAVAGLEERLRAGASIADVGTGTGIAPIRIAQAFPAARATGFDIHGPNIERGEETARREGVSDRVRFELADAEEQIPGRYDVVTMFAVVHDTSDPLALLRNARASLEDDGVVLIDELNCHEAPEAHPQPMGPIVYGFSLLHCTPQALARGDVALGAAGLPEPRLRELCVAAGFSSLERVWEGPLDAVYAARP
ncbi:MAG TPA: class I SAM-dependent methyltransferase [Actinomycetota bacterium]|nr:class I SAM-dependent methyltransferase [Actinomycetota bacterium]